MNLPYSAPVRSNHSSRSIALWMAAIAAIAIFYLVFLQAGASQSTLRLASTLRAGVNQAVSSARPAPQVVPVPVAPRAGSQPAQISATPVPDSLPAAVQSRPVPQPVATPPVQP